MNLKQPVHVSATKNHSSYNTLKEDVYSIFNHAGYAMKIW